MNITTLNSGKSTFAGCYDGFVTMTASGVNWLGRTVSDVGTGAWAGIKHVVSAVGTFFTETAKTLGAFLSRAAGAVSGALAKVKDSLSALPKETKFIAGVAVVASMVLTALACKCWNSKPADAAAPADAKTPEETKSDVVADKAPPSEIEPTNEGRETQSLVVVDPVDQPPVDQQPST